MCTIMLENNVENARFIAMNTILSRTNNFSFEEIAEVLKSRGSFVNNVVETCIEELIDNGLVYEIGSKYKVSQRHIC